MVPHEAVEQVPPAHPIWTEAQQLLHQQNKLHQKLAVIMKETSPPTGLYENENPNSFLEFVNHLRTVLSTSPRTILRQTIDSIQLLLNDVAFEPNKNNLSELRTMLDLPPDTGFQQIAQTMQGISKGSCCHRLENAQQKLEQNSKSDSEDELRTKITKSLASKNKASSPPATDHIQQMIDRALPKKTIQRQKLQEQVESLKETLHDDAEYQRYCKATSLWKTSGWERIWNNYQDVDLAVSKIRQVRGGSFEAKSC